MPLSSYREFQIDTFEVGHGLWHARAHRTDGKPMLFDGTEFAHMQVGFSWPTAAQALVDAQAFLDRIGGRLAVD